MIVELAAVGLAIAMTGPASATESTIPDNDVEVSSTVLGSGSFTMTSTNVGNLSVDLGLAAPGDVPDVVVAFISHDGRWMIDGLESGVTATMTGLLSL